MKLKLEPPLPTGYNLPDARFDMPELLTPGRKPVGAFALDKNNSIIRRMTLCVVPDKQGDARNMVDGVLYARDTSQSMRGSKTGFASYTSATRHYLNNTTYSPLNVGTGDFSMMAVVAISPSSGNSAIYHQRKDSAVPYSSILFRANSYYAQDSTSSTPTAGAVYFGGFDSNNGNSRGAYVTSGLTGELQVFVGTRKSGVWSLYGDGKLSATYDGSAFSTNVSSGIEASAIGGWTVLTTIPVLGNIYAITGWTRALSPVEAVSLTSNPYQFLIPA